MKIRLSEHFGYGRLLRFTLPSMVMLVFSSIYGVVDGFFVSNFVGKTAFTAVNFILPFLMILGSVGFMFGTGGGALIAKTMARGTTAAPMSCSPWWCTARWCACGAGRTGLSAAAPPSAVALGAEGEMLQDCLTYGTVLLPAIPVYVLQYEFQCLCVTAEKPQLGLWVTVASGLTNMVLDALLVAVLGFGLPGAAAATALSQCVGGLLPLAWFIRCRTGRLRLGAAPVGRPGTAQNLHQRFLGTDEQHLHVAGEHALQRPAAALRRGGRHRRLRRAHVRQHDLPGALCGLLGGNSPGGQLPFRRRQPHRAAQPAAQERHHSGGLRGGDVPGSPAAGRPLSRLFVGYDAAFAGHDPARLRHLLLRLCLFGIFHLRVFLLHRLNNGLVSAAISFLRTLVFQVVCVLVLPLLWQVDGIWVSLVAAEVMALCVTLTFLRAQQRVYHY